MGILITRPLEDLSREIAQATGRDVPRETIEKLILYHQILEKWQAKINLVSSSTLENAWARHFMDSAQLVKFIPEIPLATQVGARGNMIDIGSGAGFPGMVMGAITGCSITLCDSGSRKAIFLSEVARQLNLPNVTVINSRIEAITNSFDIITSRALASISEVLRLSKGIRNQSSRLILLKGKDVDKELIEAEKQWQFNVDRHRSIADANASVLIITDIKNKHENN
jgi:16S rRNA (guanine527-N7)-methyltransferase